MPSLADLKIKVFADAADLKTIRELRRNPLIKGFTTNPTLMRGAKVRDYWDFADEAIAAADGLPISFEVIADEFYEMERQAKVIASFGENVYAKIPVTNTKGESSVELIKRLTSLDAKLNVTAITTVEQIAAVSRALIGSSGAIISVFAGRIADTGVDPEGIMRHAVVVTHRTAQQVLWASTREVLNIFQADAAGCHIITVTPDLLRKLPLVGKDLTEYSLDTVRQFYADGQAAGYSL